MIWGYSSAGRAPALQAGGHRFDSDYLHQTIESRYESLRRIRFSYLISKEIKSRTLKTEQYANIMI